jgi:hypothetical protein
MNTTTTIDGIAYLVTGTEPFMTASGMGQLLDLKRPRGKKTYAVVVYPSGKTGKVVSL